MGYSSQALVENILANALTKGTSSASPVKIINVGNQVRDTISTPLMVQYIRWADEEIDAAAAAAVHPAGDPSQDQPIQVSREEGVRGGWGVRGRRGWKEDEKRLLAVQTIIRSRQRTVSGRD